MLQCSYGEFGCTQILPQEIYAKVCFLSLRVAPETLLMQRLQAITFSSMDISIFTPGKNNLLVSLPKLNIKLIKYNFSP